MKNNWAFGILALLISACSTVNSTQPQPATVTLLPSATQIPSATPFPEPTASPVPSETPVLVPTFTPYPETPQREADFSVCASGCNFRSIQAAIDSDAVPADSVIEVTESIHTEPGITVKKDLTIRGLGIDRTIVQAHETLEDTPERVFLILEGVKVTINRMTIRHGEPSEAADHGGGIMNYGDLLVNNCLITDNSADGGGGISNSTGSLTIISSTISNNTARGDGPRGEQCGGGGGIKCGSGYMRIINSAVINNQAGIRSVGSGGGIRSGCGCIVEILNTTISNNNAVLYGGGVSIGGTARINFCTITDNTAKSGALWIRQELVLENSIVAKNKGGGDCILGVRGGVEGIQDTGKIIFQSNNWIGDGSCDAAFSGNPLLASLSDNGGPTLTHALLPESAAIDAIPLEACVMETDQRGELRPAPSDSPNPGCDIGAFELY